MDNSAVNASALASLAIVYVVIIVLGLAFSIWVFWRILAKAGFNGALSLLNLIPIGGLVVLIILAFGRWPIEDQLAAAQSPMPPAPPGPPGTSVLPTV